MDPFSGSARPAAWASIAVALAWFLLVQASHPFPIEWAENYVFGYLMEFRRSGMHAYVTTPDPPWINCMYNPLYFLVCHGLSSALGLPESGRAVLFLGRTISFTAFLGIVGLVASAVSRPSPDSAFRGWAVALLAGNFQALYWATTLRPDVLAAFLGLLGAYVAFRAPGADTPASERIRWIVSGTLIAGSILTKQNVTFFLSVTVWICVYRRRSFVWFVLPCAGIVAASVAYWQRLTGGQFLDQTVGSVSQHDIIPLQAAWIALTYFMPFVPLMVLCVRRLRSGRIGPEGLWWILLGSETLWNAYAMMKDGADFNYLFNIYVLLPICAVPELRSAKVWGRAATFLVFGMTFVGLIGFGIWRLPHLRESYRNATSLLATSPRGHRYVYSESALVAVESGNEYLHVGAQKVLFGLDVMRANRLRDLIRHQELAGIVFRGPRGFGKLRLQPADETALNRALFENYRLVGEAGEFRVYHPR